MADSYVDPLTPPDARNATCSWVFKRTVPSAGVRRSL
jgi:hypothetical protein